MTSPAMGHWGTCLSPPPRLSTILFLVYFRVNLTTNYPSMYQACQSSLRRCQQITALSISTALVTKLLVIKPLLLLHPALKSAVSSPWPNFQFCPSQQILATPLLESDCLRHNATTRYHSSLRTHDCPLTLCPQSTSIMHVHHTNSTRPNTAQR